MKHLLWMVFVLFTLMIFQNWYSTEQRSKGDSISNFLFYYHNLEVPPEQARHFNIVITTYDITIEDLEIFGGAVK